MLRTLQKIKSKFNKKPKKQETNLSPNYLISEVYFKHNVRIDSIENYQDFISVIVQTIGNRYQQVPVMFVNQMEGSLIRVNTLDMGFKEAQEISFFICDLYKEYNLTTFIRFV